MAKKVIKEKQNIEISRVKLQEQLRGAKKYVKPQGKIACGKAKKRDRRKIERSFAVLYKYLEKKSFV